MCYDGDVLRNRTSVSSRPLGDTVAGGLCTLPIAENFAGLDRDIDAVFGNSPSRVAGATVLMLWPCAAITAGLYVESASEPASGANVVWAREPAENMFVSALPLSETGGYPRLRGLCWKPPVWVQSPTGMAWQAILSPEMFIM